MACIGKKTLRVDLTLLDYEVYPSLIFTVHLINIQTYLGFTVKVVDEGTQTTFATWIINGKRIHDNTYLQFDYDANPFKFEMIIV